MLRKFAALFCVAAMSVVFVGCEAATETAAPAPVSTSETTTEATDVAPETTTEATADETTTPPAAE